MLCWGLVITEELAISKRRQAFPSESLKNINPGISYLCILKDKVIPKIHWSKEWEGGGAGAEWQGRASGGWGEEAAGGKIRCQNILYHLYHFIPLPVSKYKLMPWNWSKEYYSYLKSLMGRSACCSSQPPSPGGPIEDLEFGTFGRLLQKSTTNSKFRPLGLRWDVFGTISSNAAKLLKAKKSL